MNFYDLKMAKYKNCFYMCKIVAVVYIILYHFWLKMFSKKDLEEYNTLIIKIKKFLVIFFSHNRH